VSLYRVPDMKCGGCVGAVASAIRGMDPETRIEADLETRAIKVTSTAREAALLTRLRQAGYPADPLTQPLD